MTNLNKDMIKHLGGRTLHKSAGGFLFYKDINNQVLYVALLKKEEDQGFLIPKGHIEKGESPEDAAIREVTEELSLSLEPRIIFKIGIVQYSFVLNDDPNKHDKKVHLFVLDLPNKVDLEPNRSEGFIDAQWVAFDDALKNMTFDRENLIKAHKIYLEHAND